MKKIAGNFNLHLGRDRSSEQNVKQKIQILRDIINEEDISVVFSVLYSASCWRCQSTWWSHHGQHCVSIEVLLDVNVTLHDGVEGDLLNVDTILSFKVPIKYL